MATWLSNKVTSELLRITQVDPKHSLPPWGELEIPDSGFPWLKVGKKRGRSSPGHSDESRVMEAKIERQE